MTRTCSIEGCDMPARVRGWCEKHYNRWRRNGDPHVTVYAPPLPRGQHRERVIAGGYVVVYRPGHPLADAWGNVYKHRLVAWEAGILVDPAMHVHHLNGDKADNRIENLEVLDAVEHHREHIKHRRRDAFARLLPDHRTPREDA